MEDAEEQGKRGQWGRHHNTVFYTEDGMVALSDPRWIQGEFSTLVVLFDRVGLLTNVGKTVGIVCRPCHAAWTQSEAAYGRRMTEEGPSYHDWQKGRLQRRECRE